MFRHRAPVFALVVLLIAAFGLWGVAAQEATEAPPDVVPEVTEPTEPTAPSEEPEQPAQVNVTRSEPTQIVAGQQRTLTVFGQNFTDDSVIQIGQFGVLETTLVNTNVLTAPIPANIPVGTFNVFVIDPSITEPNNRLRAGQITIVAPTATNRPRPTDEPEEDDPTSTPPPTEEQRPNLIVRGFAAAPQPAQPGDPITLTFEVFNRGNTPAIGITISVDPSGKFVPANGQAAITIPDLAAGGSFVVSLGVISAEDTTAGANIVPLTFDYRDSLGTAVESKASVSVTIAESAEISQVTLARYQINPNPARPGEPVTITVLVTNTGNELARQVLLRVAGDSGILLAGPQGDTFPLGDLPPGGSASLDLPMILKPRTDSGPQAQPLTLTFLQEGESKEAASSMTINVAEVVSPEAVLLLDAYDVGAELLRPGDRFTLDMTLRNVGDADAANLLVTFGTVESSGGNDDDNGDGDGNGSGNGTGTTTSTTPSSTFAPLGAGGTIFAGTLEGSGGEIELEQEFIVNGNVDSGVYSLPITLRYLEPDGDTAQTNLRASVVVLAPPLLRAALQAPIPETVNVGEPLLIGLDLVNNGKKTVNFINATVTAENADADPAELSLEPLRVDDDTSLEASVFPLEPGPVTVNITLNYTNDLNRPDSLTLTYTSEAVEPPPLPEMPEFPIEEPTPPPVQESNDDWLGRLLLGFLGLGS